MSIQRIGQRIGGETRPAAVEVLLDLDPIRENARRVREMVDAHVWGVVKGVDARREVVDAFVDAGIDTVAVSRVEHLRELDGTGVDVVMIRTPAKSELPDVIAAADVTLHGSIDVLERAQVEAERQGKTHRVVPMIDAGDGREGVDLATADGFLDSIERLDRLEVQAVGINLGCFGTEPDPDAVDRVARRLREYPLSVGGSGMLLLGDALPDTVSSVRIGDAILTGKWTDTPIDGLQRGAVELRAEVLTCKADEAVVYVGDVVSDPRHLVPKGDFTIKRWSNEQTVIDEAVPAGESVAFEMEYGAVATTFSSCYV